LCATASWLHVQEVMAGLLPLPPQHWCQAWQHCCVMLQATEAQTVTYKAF
jgi:hypothetical protein